MGADTMESGRTRAEDSNGNAIKEAILYYKLINRM